MDEKVEINLWLKEFKQKFHPVGQILETSYRADVLEALEKNINACATLGINESSPVQELLSRGKNLISQARGKRKESFNALMAEFIKGLKAQGVPLREFNQAWRVGLLKENPSEWWESGALEIKYNAFASTASTHYCDLPLVDSQDLTSPDDLVKLQQASTKSLERLRFDKAYLLEVFEEAMQRCCKVANAHLIPIHDFFLEIGACLTRQKLA